MNNINTIFGEGFSKLWEKMTNLALLVLILVLHLRTDSKIEAFADKVDKRFNQIELTLKEIHGELKLHSYRLDQHEKRLEKLEGK